MIRDAFTEMRAKALGLQTEPFHFTAQLGELKAFVAQSRPTLCNCMDHSPPGSSVHEASPGKNTGVGCHALLPQGIFPTQRLNPGLQYHRQILHHLGPVGKPDWRELENEAHFSVLGLFSTQNNSDNSWAGGGAGPDNPRPCEE